MVPQMNDIQPDTYDEKVKSRKEQLVELCLQHGMPVVGDEDEETLETYVEMANDDMFDDLDLDDVRDGEQDSNAESKQTIRSILGKLTSLFI